MRIVNLGDHTIISTIRTNKSLTLDEAISLVGEIITDMDDPRYDNEDGNVVIDGERYQYDKLVLWPDVDIEAARRLGRECAESIDAPDIGDNWETDAAGFVNAFGFCDDTNPSPKFMMDDPDHVNDEAAAAWNAGFQDGWEARKTACDKEEKEMTRQEIADRLNELSRNNHWTADIINDALTDIDVNGETYRVYLAGNDEMFDRDEFYQIGIDGKGNEWEFFYHTADEDGDDIDLGDIDYAKAYRIEKVEEV